MSDEGARKFLQHLKQDPELQRRISSEVTEVTDRDAVVALTIHMATEAGFKVDAPSMERALGELAAAASERVGEELDDDQLEAVAGGTFSLLQLVNKDTGVSAETEAEISWTTGGYSTARD